MPKRDLFTGEPKTDASEGANPTVDTGSTAGSPSAPSNAATGAAEQEVGTSGHQACPKAAETDALSTATEDDSTSGPTLTAPVKARALPPGMCPA